VDLLQILILLVIMGICGAIAVLLLGFSPRGVMIMLFSIITGTIGAALGGWLKAILRLPDFFPIKVGTIRFDVLLTFICALLVVGLLQLLLGGIERRASRGAD
jgi:hypothetical protein